MGKGKLRVLDNGTPIFEVEGDLAEIFDYINRTMGKRSLSLSLEPPKKESNHPSTQEVAEYIEKLGGNMEHSMKGLSMHFYGKSTLLRRDNRRDYDVFFNVMRRAHRLLRRKYGIQFESKVQCETKTQNGTANRPYRIYYAVKKVEPEEPYKLMGGLLKAKK